MTPHLEIILGAIFGLLTAVSIFQALRASRDPVQKFSIEDLFLDGKTGRASLSKLGQFMALCVSSWGFVFLTLNGTLTEWFYGTYMVAWSGTSLVHKWLDQQKGKP